MKRRPGRLWIFFWGRRRGGAPWLLIGVVALAVGLGLAYAIPAGVNLSYYLGLAFLVVIALLAAGSLALALYALLRPRRPR